MNGSYALEMFPRARAEQAAQEARLREQRGVLLKLGYCCKRGFDSTVSSVRSKLPMYWTPKPIRNLVRDIKAELDAQQTTRPLPALPRRMPYTPVSIRYANTASAHYPVMEPDAHTVLCHPNNLTTSTQYSVMDSSLSASCDTPSNSTIESSANWARIGAASVASMLTAQRLAECEPESVGGSKRSVASDSSERQLLSSDYANLTDNIASTTFQLPSTKPLVSRQSLEEHLRCYTALSEYSDAYLDRLDETIEKSLAQWDTQIDATRSVLHADATTFSGLSEDKLASAFEDQSQYAVSEYAEGPVNGAPLEAGPFILAYCQPNQISEVDRVESLTWDGSVQRKLRGEMSMHLRNELRISEVRPKTIPKTLSGNIANTEQGRVHKVLRHVRQRISERTSQAATTQHNTEVENGSQKAVDTRPAQIRPALRRVKVRITNSLKFSAYS